ncbi:hypothetical protein HPB49_026214 [Dermacentor silvarum]|nr:hypothetical protein HPB49_026214 [Dermacentor silvarum]
MAPAASLVLLIPLEDVENKDVGHEEGGSTGEKRSGGSERAPEPCDYYEQCVFAQLNGVCTDHLIGDCALEFVRSLDGKTCDKLQTTAGNVSDSPARPTVNATLPEPLASRTGPQLSRLYKYYATITWTVHDRLLKNLIDRSTLSTVKNDGPVKVTKATIALGSMFEDTCTSNAQREPRGASCSEGRYLYKPSEPPCDYSEQCVFAQLNGVCTDHLIGDCALEFVRSLDGKTCDKLQTPTGNVLDSPARPTVNATQPEPLASRTYSHSSDHGPAPSADWPDPDGSGDFYEDQFRLGNANSLRPAAPYDADRQRALLEGPFHRAPVQQLSLTCPTNDPAPCSILESCSALSRLYKYYATITWTVHDRLLKNLIDRSTLSTVKNDGPVKVFKIAINQLERLRSDNGKFVFECTALSTRRSPRQPSRLVPCSRTPARATPSASLAGPRAARAATSTSHPSP